MSSFLVTSGLSSDTFRGKYVFLDTDFLSLLASNVTMLREILTLTSAGTLLIEPNIRFEFLRSVFLPARLKVLQEFIDNHEVFMPASDHQTQFQQLRDNAYMLSYLYAHNDSKGASMVDLFLAGRALLHGPENVLIISGNRKDFPHFLFDIVGILNCESEKVSSISTYSILSLNLEKYHLAVKRWQAL